MSRQRDRHLKRQPLEELIRLEIAQYVGAAGSVDIEVHDLGRKRDLLVLVKLRQAPVGSVLELFRAELASRMVAVVPRDHPLQDWLVVIELSGKTLANVSAYETSRGEFDEQHVET